MMVVVISVAKISSRVSSRIRGRGNDTAPSAYSSLLVDLYRLGEAILTLVYKRILLPVGSKCSKGRLELGQTGLSQSLVAKEIIDGVKQGTELGKCLLMVSCKLRECCKIAHLSTKIHRVKIRLHINVLRDFLLGNRQNLVLGRLRKCLHGAL